MSFVSRIRGALFGALLTWPATVQAQDTVRVGEETKRAAGTIQTSFCSATETVVFSCRTGAKMVSVCTSRDAGPARGYLQYRFGKPDSSEPLELVLPAAQVAPAKAANGANEGYSGGGGSWLRFFNRPATYTVYSGIGNWGPRAEKRVKEGLLVERNGNQVANLACSGKLMSELGPDWFEKAGVERGNQEFFFPD